MRKLIFPLCVVLLILSCRTAPKTKARMGPQPPPLPPGAALMARTTIQPPPPAPKPAVVPVPGQFQITNITVQGSQVTLKWQNPPSNMPVQVQAATDIRGPWANIGFPNGVRAKTTPKISSRYFRLFGPISTLSLTNSGQPRGCWTTIEAMPNYIAEWNVLKRQQDAEPTDWDVVADLYTKLDNIATLATAFTVPANGSSAVATFNETPTWLSADDGFDRVNIELVGQFIVTAVNLGAKQATLKYSPVSEAPNNTHSGEVAPIGAKVGQASFRDPSAIVNRTWYTAWGYRDDDTVAKLYPIKQNAPNLVGADQSPGKLVWARHISCTFRAEVASIAVDAGQYVYVTGYFTETATFGTGEHRTSLGGQDAFIAKYDGHGDFQWVKTISGIVPGGANGDQAGLAIVIGPDNEPIVAGSFQGTVDFGSGPITSAGYTDIFIGKWQTDGTLRWIKTYGASGPDATYAALTVDSLGNPILTTSFQHTVDFGGGFILTSTGSSIDAVVLKLLAINGTTIWAKQIGGSPDSYPYGIGVDTAGNVYVTGQTYGDKLNFGPGPIVGADGIFLGSYTSLGALRWGKVIASGGLNAGWGIFYDQLTGKVFLSGGARGAIDFGGGTRTTLYDGGVFIASYDPATGAYGGWDVYTGGPGDVSFCITGDTLGRFLFAGVALNGMNFNLGWKYGTGNFAGLFQTSPSGASIRVSSTGQQLFSRSQTGVSASRGAAHDLQFDYLGGWFQTGMTLGLNNEVTLFGQGSKDGFFAKYYR